MVPQVEGQASPVNLPSSRGLSTPGSPATTITVSPHLCRLKHTCIIISVSNTQTLTRDLIPCGCVCSGSSERRAGGLQRPGSAAQRQSHPAGGASGPDDLPAAPQLLAARPAAQRGALTNIHSCSQDWFFGKRFLKCTGFVDTLCSFANWKGTCDISEFVQ